MGKRREGSVACRGYVTGYLDTTFSYGSNGSDVVAM